MSETTNTPDRPNVVSTRVGVLAELLKELNPFTDMDAYRVVFGLLVRAEQELRELHAQALG